MSIVQDLINHKYNQGRFINKSGVARRHSTEIDKDKAVYRVHQDIAVSTQRGVMQTTGWDLSFSAETGNGESGRYIPYKNNATVMGEMDNAHSIMVSGEFTGCAFQVVRCQTHGTIYCAHVYRPGGNTSNMYMDLFDEFKQYMNYDTLVSVSTKGISKIEGTDSGCFLAERTGNTISVVLIHISGNGTILDVTSCGSHTL